MNKQEKRNRKYKSSFSGFGVIAALLLLESVTSVISGGGTAALIAIIVVLAIAGIAAGFFLAKKKGSEKGSVYSAERARERAKQLFMREEYEDNNQAVKCTHPRGREKYVHQLDNFLATGLIDKNEYRVLKERYDKLNIPDNLH